MTMKIEDTTIKVKVKKHPNESRYPGRACRDTLFKITEFITKLSPEQMTKFSDGTLYWEPNNTLTEIQSFLPKDQIGVLLQYENGFIPTVMEIESIDQTKQEILGKDLFSKEELEVSFAEISVARALDFLEILYRDNKPYGQPEEQELKVRIMHNEPDDNVKEQEQNNTEAPVK